LPLLVSKIAAIFEFRESLLDLTPFDPCCSMLQSSQDAVGVDSSIRSIVPTVGPSFLVGPFRSHNRI